MGRNLSRVEGKCLKWGQKTFPEFCHYRRRSLGKVALGCLNIKPDVSGMFPHGPEITHDFLAISRVPSLYIPRVVFAESASAHVLRASRIPSESEFGSLPR